jgi:hypothetical protein
MSYQFGRFELYLNWIMNWIGIPWFDLDLNWIVNWIVNWIGILWFELDCKLD